MEEQVKLSKELFKEAIAKIKADRPVKDGKYMPYVLFGRFSRLLKDGKKVFKPDTFLLDCSGSTGQAAIIKHYVRNKGYLILDSFFPDMKGEMDAIPRGAVGVHYWSGKSDGRDPFAELRTEVRYLTEPGEKIAKLEAENAELRKVAKLAEEKSASGVQSIDERTAEALKQADEATKAALDKAAQLEAENAELRKKAESAEADAAKDSKGGNKNK